MRLKLKDLKQIVDNTLAEEKTTSLLREEVSRVLGPSVITNVKLKRLAEEANDRLDVLERTGRTGRLDFKPSVMLSFAKSSEPEVRRLAARVLPEQYISQFRFDKDPAVRHAAAKRLPLPVLKEMVSKSSSDDELHTIYQMRLHEDGIPDPKRSETNKEKYFQNLKDVSKRQIDMDLSDGWYTSTALKAIRDYQRNIEGQWDEAWVNRYCSSLRSPNGVEVDPVKLWKEIQRQLKTHDDFIMQKFSLKEVATALRDSEPYVESVDPVAELLESNACNSEYVERAKQIFSIRESFVPPGIKKYLSNVGVMTETKIPCIGKVPHRAEISRLDERALDTFVKKWNDVQAQRGEPIRISWSPSPSAMGAITFNAELK